MSFHVRDGWYFEPREDGSVRIAKISNACVHEIILTKNDWASVKKVVEVDVVPQKGRGAKMTNPPLKIESKPVVTKPKPFKPISPQSHAAVISNEPA